MGILSNKWVVIAALVVALFFVYTRFVQPRLSS